MSEVPTVDLHWLEADSADRSEANRDTARRVEAMIDAGQRKTLVTALEGWPPAAVLECFAGLRTKRAQKLLKWVSDDLSFRLLSELDPTFHGVLFEEETRAKFAKILSRLDRDKAQAFVLALPREYSELLVDAHPDAAYLREVLADSDSAQAAMKRGAVIARETGTVGDVIADIRARQDQIDKIDSLHVVDEAGRLTGYLKLRDLILNPDETPVADVARRKPLTVTRDTDREAVLRLAKKRKEGVIAVVDNDSVLLGVIAPSELADIARREAAEDMLLLSGVSPDSTAFDTPVQLVKRRLPWLAAGLIGSAIAATVIGSFEHALAAAAILASFIPVVMATAGNAGMQAASVSLQAIAGDRPDEGRLPRRVLREVLGALLNGVLLGGGVALVILAVSLFAPIDRPLWLGATVMVSICCVVLLASTVGTVMPFVLRAMGRDPAAATGIFILGSNDVFGVLIYFTVASLLYL